MEKGDRAPNVIESSAAVTLCYSSSRAHGGNLDSDWTIRRKGIMQVERLRY
jgi:hypothetical protein